MMNAPSIEARLSRKNPAEGAYRIMKYVDNVPVLGSLTRAWIRAGKTVEPKALWASLPPLATT